MMVSHFINSLGSVDPTISTHAPTNAHNGPSPPPTNGNEEPPALLNLRLLPSESRGHILVMFSHIFLLKIRVRRDQANEAFLYFPIFPKELVHSLLRLSEKVETFVLVVIQGMSGLSRDQASSFSLDSDLHLGSSHHYSTLTFDVRQTYSPLNRVAQAPAPPTNVDDGPPAAATAIHETTRTTCGRAASSDGDDARHCCHPHEVSFIHAQDDANDNNTSTAHHHLPRELPTTRRHNTTTQDDNSTTMTTMPTTHHVDDDTTQQHNDDDQHHNDDNTTRRDTEMTAHLSIQYAHAYIWQYDIIMITLIQQRLRIPNFVGLSPMSHICLEVRSRDWKKTVTRPDQDRKRPDLRLRSFIFEM
ncbi:uncharacterized protein LACBIDRAFT_332150 [Laccaria bicolor S238N-H82]|uniref:Predicted protein n=1 Tax=Laccaria bicolor (strain S238N-H82 / ATCC MYA-4686) TaxID=486041 RepID=B0DRR6_LACBS|nr:uncharacterized protein LACBIDRAFT_332150 [Laccaria bicolor S238N-H82]EDR02654.1 predicted protein [Laccaria bicolor S238N-H82]|eukprot:XP_001886698.1 predicted protein [Laccaria bicolor S238N-H82]